MNMKILNINAFKSIDEYVSYKTELLKNSDKSMKTLFEMMFSDKDNVMFEETDGFRIKTTTYGEAYASVLSFSSAIYSEIGKETGGIVGLYMENSHEWIEIFWAILRAGFHPMLLNSRLSCELLNSVMEENNVIAVISEKKIFSVRTILLDELKEKAMCAMDIPQSVSFGEEMLVMSSGTSDSLKCCVYSAFELASTIETSAYVLSINKRIKGEYEGRVKLLTFLPFYHIFGFVAVYLWFGFFSCTFVKLNDFDPQTIINTVKKHRVTHIFAVPLFWETVYRKAVEGISKRGEKTYEKFQKGLKISDALGNSLLGKVFSKKAFSGVRDNIFGDSIKFMITGGSVISPEVLRFFNGIGYYLVNGYGMSEIGITSVELSENRKIINSCSIGMPLPSVEYMVDEKGELYVKGNSLAKYVIEHGKKTVIQNDWFKTNDLAYMEGDRYFIKGRGDDVIVSLTGENLNPDIIEQKLSVPDTEGVCLIGGEDNKLPILIVSVKRTLEKSKAEQVLKETKKKITEQNLSGSIGNISLISDPLIKADEFKLNRKRIRRDFFDGRLKKYSFASQTEDAATDDITEKVREYFAIALGKDISDININSDFFLDEGGTSLDYFALISEIGHNYGINIPTDGELALTSVEAIADYIRGRR